MKLSEKAKQFEALGIQIIGMTYDSPMVLSKFSNKEGISYPILSDTESQVIRQLGLLNESMPKGTRYFGVPYPGIFLLDADLIIRGKFAEEDYRGRPLISDLLAAARQMTDS